MRYRETKLCKKARGARSSAILLKRNKKRDKDLHLSGSRKDSCYGWICHRCFIKGDGGHFQVGKQHVGSSLSHTATPAVPYNAGFPVAHSQILRPLLKWYYLDKGFSRSNVQKWSQSATYGRQEASYSIKASLDCTARRTPHHHFCSSSAHVPSCLGSLLSFLALMVSHSSVLYSTF